MQFEMLKKQVKNHTKSHEIHTDKLVVQCYKITPAPNKMGGDIEILQSCF